MQSAASALGVALVRALVASVDVFGPRSAKVRVLRFDVLGFVAAGRFRRLASADPAMRGAEREQR